MAPSVSIGDGAVVTARSSVFSDIPPWTVAKGNPAVLRELGNLSSSILDERRRVFELGCGNGSVENVLTAKGWDVTGLDSSTLDIEQAKINCPHLKLCEGSVYDDLVPRYDQLPVVTSPGGDRACVFPSPICGYAICLLEPEGTVVMSTLYNGYRKNPALAITGKMDAHFTALLDHGHIKYWSMKTLSQLLREAGFVKSSFERVGRVPTLAKSMIAVARKQ